MVMRAVIRKIALPALFKILKVAAPPRTVTGNQESICQWRREDSARRRYGENVVCWFGTDGNGAKGFLAHFPTAQSLQCDFANRKITKY